MTLKEEAINGVLWNTFGTLASFAVEFVIGIVLARILSPAEFGLIGTIMVVIAISQVFVNSGFSQAIVRKQDCTQEDYSTAFFFNLVAGIALYLILFVTAGPISRFFNNSELGPLIRVLGLVLIISSFTLIQQSILIKMIDFKLQTRIAIIASVLSGIVAIIMAFQGFGVWSLIAKSLTNQGIISCLLWYYNRWRPDLVFNTNSFRELFGFGSKLMISGLIGTFFNNIYYAAIGKYFSAPALGFYTRAELFKNIPSQTAEKVITAVGYPVLARVQNDPQRLNSAFRQILTTSFFIVSVFMFGMAAVADSMVVTLIGEQWRQSVLYLQMLCFVGLLYPLNSINVNLLNVVGRSDLYLKLQLISQLLTVPVIVFGILFGIKIMIFGMCLNSLISYFYFSKISSRFSGYSVGNQLKDILPVMLVTFLMGAIVYVVDYISDFRPIVTLIVQISTGLLIMLFAGETLGLKEHKFIKSILLDNFNLFTKKVKPV